MLKMMTSGMFVMGLVTAPVVLSPRHAPAPAPDYRNDPRLETLRTFFRNAACPAVEYAAAFLEAADFNELDWRLLPSLSYVETTGGKSARNNNLFGWDSGRARFPSPIAGIHAVGYRLSHSDLYKDKELDALLATYNPNLEYRRMVKSVMRRIAPSE
jgi:hypothetical protein